MHDWLESTLTSGSLLLAAPIAVLAGMVSFLSPCVIPLLPGYLSYTTGLSGADLADPGQQPPRGRMLAGSSLFVLGFSVVFVSLGVLSASASRWFFVNQGLFTIALGALTTVLGLVFMDVLPLFRRAVRVQRFPGVGLASAPLLGFLFGIGWQPCIGPTLAVIIGLATYLDQVRGGLLLGFYSLGLGLPFIAAAVAWRRAIGAISWVRRHQRWVTRAGGVMLICVGLLLLSGWWDHAVQWLQIELSADYEPSL